MKKLLSQIIKFGAVGGIAFVIDYGIYVFMTHTLNINYIIAQTVAFLIATIFNYVASVKFVFDSKYGKEDRWKETLSFIILSIIGWLITVISLSFFVEIMHFNTDIAKILATALAMVWNFVTRKLLIEKK